MCCDSLVAIRQLIPDLRIATPIFQIGLWSFVAKRFEVALASLRSSGAQRFCLVPLGLTILVCWAWTSQAAAQSVTVAWDPAASAAGYRLYSGTTSHVYTQQTDVGDVTSALISNLVIGQTYFFAVTAYNTTGFELPSLTKSRTPRYRQFRLPYRQTLLALHSPLTTLPTLRRRHFPGSLAQTT